MYTKFRFSLIACFLLSVFASYGQMHFNKAEKQFDLKAYDLAIANYKLALEKKKDCVDCIFKIGEAYRLQNQSLEAAIWYRKIADRDDLPQDFHLNYGNVMKKMGQYDKAQKHFVKFQEYNPELGEHFALSCDFAKITLGEDANHDISLFGGSSRQSDYGSVFFKDRLVYASFRKDILRDVGKLEESSLMPLGSQLFISRKESNVELDKIDFLRDDESEQFDITNISYAESGNTCAITKSTYPMSGMEIIGDDDDMHIYIAEVDANGAFLNPEPFQYNEVGYATGFPALSFDGKAMYFSSNRPGGFGGYDLYVSYRKDGEWSYPENLGENINTTGNEITPYLAANTLYFASDYHHGLGGYDIFTSKVGNKGWNYPTNLGNGVNSPEDDFYPSVDKNTENIYLTSNRIGGRGNHDIYIASPIRKEEIIAVAPSNISVKPTPVANTEVEKTIVATPATAQPAPTSTAVASSTPPKAVNLEELERKAKVGTISVSGAKKVTYGEILNTSNNVYFIQLAALYHSVGNVNKYQSLINYGSIYKLAAGNVTKIKLGYFLDRYEAEQTLASLKNQGYTDAFITYDDINGGQMELVASKDDTNVSFGNQYTGGVNAGTQYKVRLAAYEDAIWFEVNKVKDLGVIEQWSKKNWTIFVLSGYGSMQEAEQAKISAMNRGFTDAEVVVDRNGVLETIKSY